jgi:hypothetical protein
MNLKQMFSIWRRRWVLTTALLLLALVGTAAATQVLPKYYQAQSMVTLLPSTNFSKTNGNNPYLSFDGSLPVTAQLIGYQLMDPRTVQTLSNEGYSASYSTGLALNSTGPVLQTVVIGNNKALVERTLYGATNEITAELASLQSGITSTKNKITVETLSFDPKPTLEVSKTARPIVVVLFFGIVLALAIPLVVDGQLGRSQKLSRKPPARRAVRATGPTGPAVPGPRIPAPSAPTAPAVSPAQPEQAARPVTPAARPEWAGQPAEPVTPAARPEWTGQPAEPDWDSKPPEPDWLPATPSVRPQSAAKPEWPAAPVPQPARTEWPAAPVPPPSRPEWMGKPSAERNGADTSARTDWPAKPATSLFGSDRDEPAKPATSMFERDRDEPAKPAPPRFQRDSDEPAAPASSRFHRDESATPASSRFHRDDDGPAKPMPWDEDRSGDASPAAKASPAAGGGADSNGKGADSNGKNGSGKDGHDRETVAVPARSPNADDPDDDGPATQPQERVT